MPIPARTRIDAGSITPPEMPEPLGSDYAASLALSSAQADRATR
ncbi:hypothetical protein MBELCI_1004 [Limimaricola cinnabarinus LL-001]|uniref:Uncharacterized protein n=1 Tax=Limimaricola cinnabarinus LL-001 TaxID=1337093 RepID=U2Z1K5_9RHOB|nr:hypothetical protein MBELCI_1004 [Limimaricola cinnabarinus LL-001]